MANFSILPSSLDSVDAETDTKMQQVIRSEFGHHTIIMIAHRVSSLRDFDLVLTLDRGRLVELASPTELLRIESSHFARAYNGFM
jgi:ABC-type multidrug transport system fused ATPase/permease subunit